MDFLTQLSIRYTEKSAVVDEEDPDDQGGEINKMCLLLNYVVDPFLVFTSLIRPSKCPHLHLHRFSILEQFQNVATRV